MSNNVNVYKNNEKINSFKSVHAAFACYANDISENNNLKQYSHDDITAKMASNNRYTPSYFALLNNGNYIMNNYTFDQIQNFLLTIGVELFKIDDDGNDIILDDDMDVIIDDMDDNNDVNEKCHLHHILPKSSYPGFANLDKYEWNGILLPSNIHASFHSFMGGYNKSSDESMEWFNMLFEFLESPIIKKQIPKIDLINKKMEFKNGLNDYIDGLKNIL
jgi:hypothetical protein